LRKRDASPRFIAQATNTNGSVQRIPASAIQPRAKKAPISSARNRPGEMLAISVHQDEAAEHEEQVDAKITGDGRADMEGEHARRGNSAQGRQRFDFPVQIGAR